MINRQSCYSALFKLKDAGIDISDQLKMMSSCSGVPRGVIEFLRDNSPQFQFYRHLQKHQRKLSESILDYESLSDIDKMITCCSFMTRAFLAVKYSNLDESLLDDLGISEASEAVNTAISERDFSKVNEFLKKHNESMRLFYKE